MRQNYGIYLEKNMGYICNTLGYFGLNYKLKYGIYLAKITGFI